MHRDISTPMQFTWSTHIVIVLGRLEMRWVAGWSVGSWSFSSQFPHLHFSRWHRNLTFPCWIQLIYSSIPVLWKNIFLLRSWMTVGYPEYIIEFTPGSEKNQSNRGGDSWKQMLRVKILFLMWNNRNSRNAPSESMILELSKHRMDAPFALLLNISPPETSKVAYPHMYASTLICIGWWNPSSGQVIMGLAAIADWILLEFR